MLTVFRLLVSLESNLKGKFHYLYLLLLLKLHSLKIQIIWYIIKLKLSSIIIPQMNDFFNTIR